MARGATPVEQRRLRAELRRLREAAGHTQKAVAKELGWSVSKVIRLETGAVHVSTSDLMALLSYYEVDDRSQKDTLLAITRGKEQAWWDAYRSDYPQHFLNFLGYEDAAVEIQQFVGLVVPGLLQTEEYIRALFAGYTVEPERIDRGVQVRLQRQEILTRDDAPKAKFILDEAVLHRWVGSPQLMIDQLSRLKVLAELPNVSLRIVPFTAGVHSGMLGSFTVLELPSGAADYVVAIDNQNRDTLIRDDVETSSMYVETFSQLQELACPEEDADKIIDPVIESMRHGMRS